MKAGIVSSSRLVGTLQVSILLSPYKVSQVHIVTSIPAVYSVAHYGAPIITSSVTPH